MCATPLVLGTVADYITGEIIDDTLDERTRQQIARSLVEEKGYDKDDITVRRSIDIEAGGKNATVQIDILVVFDDKIRMLIQYCPGAIGSRHRPVLAAARLAAPYQIPVVVIANGLDANILDGLTGDITATGMDAIPSKSELETRTRDVDFKPIDAKRKAMEARIMYAFEINDSCACSRNACDI